MCCFLSCCVWVIDFLQRIVTVVLGALICCIVCVGLVIAVAAGVAYGYNYSMSEFLTYKRVNTSVYMRRGTLRQGKDFQMDMPAPKRRSESNAGDLSNSARTSKKEFLYKKGQYLRSHDSEDSLDSWEPYNINMINNYTTKQQQAPFYFRGITMPDPTKKMYLSKEKAGDTSSTVSSYLTIMKFNDAALKKTKSGAIMSPWYITHSIQNEMNFTSAASHEDDANDKVADNLHFTKQFSKAMTTPVRIGDVIRDKIRIKINDYNNANKTVARTKPGNNSTETEAVQLTPTPALHDPTRSPWSTYFLTKLTTPSKQNQQTWDPKKITGDDYVGKDDYKLDDLKINLYDYTPDITRTEAQIIKTETSRQQKLQTTQKTEPTKRTWNSLFKAEPSTEQIHDQSVHAWHDWDSVVDKGGEDVNKYDYTQDDIRIEVPDSLPFDGKPGKKTDAYNTEKKTQTTLLVPIDDYVERQYTTVPSAWHSPPEHESWQHSDYRPKFSDEDDKENEFKQSNIMKILNVDPKDNKPAKVTEEMEREERPPPSQVLELGYTTELVNLPPLDDEELDKVDDEIHKIRVKVQGIDYDEKPLPRTKVPKLDDADELQLQPLGDASGDVTKTQIWERRSTEPTTTPAPLYPVHPSEDYVEKEEYEGEGEYNFKPV